MENVNRKSLKNILLVIELAEIKKIDSLPEVEFEHSDKYNTFLTNLIESSKKEEKFKKKIAKRKALIIAALLSLIALTVTACSVVTPIREFIIEVFEKYTQISNPNEDTTNVEPEYSLDYIPEGFAVDMNNCFNTKGMSKLQYTNGKKILTLSIFVGSSISGFDSEESPSLEKKIDEKTVYIFTKWKNDQAVWTDENFLFTLSYPEELDFSEVEKMIRSVAPIGE